MSYNTHPPSLTGRIFVAFLRKVVQTPPGIKLLSLTGKIYQPPKDNWLDITRAKFELPCLPPEFEGFRIVQISDFHLGTWLTRERLAETIDLVNHQKADIIALTGDFVTINPEKHVEELAVELGRLQPRYVSLAVLGNHDHWTDAELVRTCLKSAHIIELRNDVFTLQRGNARIHIAGIDDFMVSNDRLDEVLARLPEGECTILLAHEPDFADFSSKCGRFALQLSGHSHGGQIILPGIGPLYLPRYARKYPAGRYQVNGMWLYTTTGVGTAEIQFRLNTRPEIAVHLLYGVSSRQPDSF